jgi:hypothetical protein
VRKTVLLYGLLGGVLIAGLKFIEYRFLVVEHSLEIYGGLVALLFSSVGIWLGLKLTKTKETIVVKEVAVPPFVVNEAGESSSALRRARWRSWSSWPRASATARSPSGCSSARTR